MEIFGKLLGKYLIETFREKCTGCNKCIRNCPVEGADIMLGKDSTHCRTDKNGNYIIPTFM